MRKLFSLIILICISTSVDAQNNPKLNIQGILRDDADQAVSDGTYQLTFKLYDVATGGVEIWTEDQSLDITNGVYSTLLGDITDLSTVAFDTQYFLGIAVDGSLELSPRIPLSLSPYAIAVVGSENVFPSTGTVGIGTVSPNSDAKLHVADGDLVVSNGELHLSTSNIKMDGNWISGDGDDEGIHVNTNGHVGIGTSDVEEEFQVSGISFFEGITRFNRPSVVVDGETLNYDIWIQGGSNTLSGDSRNLALVGDETTDILYLNFEGEYKQGTVMGSRTLGVGGFLANRIATHRSGGYRRLGANNSETGNSNQVSGYKFTGDNDTGMFSHSDGVINFFTNSSERIWIDDRGIKCGDNMYNCGLRNNFSDRRVKKGIKHYSNLNALERIMKLQPASYTFRFKDAQPLSHGFIAQEVEDIFPHAVTDSEDTKVLEDGTVIENVKELDYDVLTMELILAVQQLNKKVDSLIEENQSLKRKLTSIKSEAGEKSSPKTEK